MSREVPVASRESLPATEVARLEAVRRLAMGAAHALNNAFTAVVGETSFLHDDRKQDREVAETCEAILAEMDRCTRITRALLARRHPSQAGGGDVDMVRLVRELSNLLNETLGSENELQTHWPDDLLPVEGEAGALELLVLTLVHYGADTAPGPSRLELAVGHSSEGDVEIRLAVDAQGVPEEVAVAFVQPDLAPDALSRTQLLALGELLEAHGGWRMAEQPGPDRWIARVLLPALD